MRSESRNGSCSERNPTLRQAIAAERWDRQQETKAGDEETQKTVAAKMFDDMNAASKQQAVRYHSRKFGSSSVTTAVCIKRNKIRRRSPGGPDWVCAARAGRDGQDGKDAGRLHDPLRRALHLRPDRTRRRGSPPAADRGTQTNAGQAYLAVVSRLGDSTRTTSAMAMSSTGRPASSAARVSCRSDSARSGDNVIVGKRGISGRILNSALLCVMVEIARRVS